MEDNSKSSTFFKYLNIPHVEDPRFCPVCDSEAPDGEVHKPHFGAICCYSCRAFFRRSVHCKAYKDLTCKDDESCSLSIEISRKCPRCRLLKCVRSGMKAEFVMNEKEKKLRFKNYYKKKDSEMKGLRGQDSSMDFMENHSETPTTENIDTSTSPSNMRANKVLKVELGSDENLTRQEVEAKNLYTSTVLDPRFSLRHLHNQSQLKGNYFTGHQMKMSNSSKPSKYPQSHLRSSPATHPGYKQPHLHTQGERSKSHWQLPSQTYPQYNPYSSYHPRPQTCQDPRYTNSGFDMYGRAHPCPQAMVWYSLGPNFPNTSFSSSPQHLQDTYMMGPQSPNRHYNPGPGTNYVLPRNDFVHPSCSNFTRDPSQDGLSRLSKNDQEKSCRAFRYPGMEPMGLKRERTDVTLQHSQDLLSDVNHWNNEKEALIEHQLDLAYEKSLDQNKLMQAPSPVFFTESEAPFRGKLGQKIRQNKKTEQGFLSLKFQLEVIPKALSACYAEFRVKNLGLVQKLRDFHQKIGNLDSEDFTKLMDCVGHIMNNFANSLYIFKSLAESDQRILLALNLNLIQQFIFARYACSSTGIEQIGWITGSEPEDVDESTYQVVPLRDLDEILGLFSTPDHASLFEIKARTLTKRWLIPMSCTSLLANALLYNVDQDCVEHLKEPDRIRCIFNEAAQGLMLGIKSSGNPVTFHRLEPLIQDLVFLKGLMTKCSFAEVKEGSPTHLTLRYTTTEDLCLKSSFIRFEATLGEVVPPSAYMYELFNLLHHGEPTSPNFVGVYIAFTLERFRKILKSHSEFQNLSGQNQLALWAKNSMTCVVLNTAQINTIKTGKDQVKNLLGFLSPENNLWKVHFENIIDLDSLSGAYLSTPQVNNGRLDESQLACFQVLMKDLTELVSNPYLYHLLVLLSLFDTKGLDSRAFSGIKEIKNQYLKLFQRKVIAAGCSYVDYAKFKQVQTKVNKFSELLRLFMAPASD